MTKKTTRDNFKPIQPGMPAGTSGARQNIYPSGPYEGGKTSPDNGRELLHGIGSSGSIRARTGLILSLGGNERAINPTVTGYGTAAGFVTVPVAPLLDVTPGTLLVDARGGTSLLIQEMNMAGGFAYVFANPFPISIQLFLNQIAVTDELSLAPVVSSQQLLQGAPGTVNLSAKRFSYVGNMLLHLAFDQVLLRNYLDTAAVFVRGVFATENATITPLPVFWSSN